MKKIILSTIFITYTLFAFSQSITLKSGIIATYQLNRGADKKFTLTLIDSKAINQESYVTDDMLKEKVDSNQVKMILFNRQDEKDKRASFIIKTGMLQVLKYSAAIKRAGRRKFIITDVMPVQGKIISNEMWPYEVTEIMLSDFEEGSL